ncbi:hypothetical protein EJB05_01816, partial [Eragrostis curvula]
AFKVPTCNLPDEEQHEIRERISSIKIIRDGIQERVLRKGWRATVTANMCWTDKMEAASAVNPATSPDKIKKHSTATFHPTLWGDFFLSYELPTKEKEAQMQERARVLQEQVRDILNGTTDLPEVLDLIVKLQRLGLDKNYEDEINKQLDVVYHSDYDGGDLGVVSLRFYLLRKNGYNVSSDVFLNFQDGYGNFIYTDIRSLLSLYNAAYLRTHGEALLDKAISFTRRCLQCRLEHLESPLAEEVSSALDTPLFRRAGIYEARNYIPIYGKEATHNETVLELAKLNFNLLQLLYCNELNDLTLWWKELRVESNLSFVRDRIVEIYFWMNGACSDPHYSHSRIILTKIIAFESTIDDVLDTYATTQEGMAIVDAIYSWDESALHLLPEYFKDFYLRMLDTFRSFERELGHDKSYRVFYLKESFKDLIQTHRKELEWRDQLYVPRTMKEHLEVSSISIGGVLALCASFVGMDDIITKNTMDWVSSCPELIKSFGIFARFSNDIVSTKREQMGKHSASTVQCYMEEHGTTMANACEKIKELTEDSWKYMIEQCLVLTEQPKVVPRTVLNFARTVDYIYKTTDSYTFSYVIKDMITLLYVKPIPL